MSKYTPGPWTWGISTDTGPDDNYYEQFYKVYGPEARLEGESEEDAANAQLISMAPELLEALKTAVAGWEGDIRSEYEGTGSMLDDLLKQLEPLKAAIAKAEGK